ncbi:MAG: helix-turn-helix transcriptional regulator [Acidimicrobiia bacterium]
MTDTPDPGTLRALSTSRQDLLLALKKAGEARAEELAATLGVTVSAVRQLIDSLVNEGLVAFREERGGRGRPKHWYRLTRDAEGFFPKAYGGLTNELLGYVTDADPALVDAIFERRRQRRVAQAKARLEGRDFPAKVRELARILDEDGYLADFEALPDGTFRVTEHNCAVLDVAERYGGACSSEISFLREALEDARIERVSHMIAGAHSCAYVIQPPAFWGARTTPHVATTPQNEGR